MNEAEWLASANPQEMYIKVVQPLKRSRRRTDLFCVACAQLVLHLIEDPEAKRAFEWLEDDPGQRYRPDGGNVRELFHGPAWALYIAHRRRERVGVSGAAVHVAYDLWANWYEYAFPNLHERFVGHPHALREDPSIYLAAVMRDIFGNPFRRVSADPAWLTSTVRNLAQHIYDSRDFSAMPILADALQDAGCDHGGILTHCRGPGPHHRGCFAIELALGLE